MWTTTQKTTLRLISSVVIGVLFASCTLDEDAGTSALPQTAYYREIETGLTDETANDFRSLGEEIHNSNLFYKEKTEIIFDPTSTITTREQMYGRREEIECGDDTEETRGECQTVGTYGQDYNLPELPNNILDTFKWVKFYGIDDFVYTIGSVDRPVTPTGDDIYSILKNNDEIFSHKMYFGSDGPIEDASLVLSSPAFTFYDLEKWENKDLPSATAIWNRNIWYKGETMNEKYNMDASSYLFAFEDKIGFIGEKDSKKFIIFNGQKISADFDEIISSSCCASATSPVKLDKMGVLFSLAKRGETYYFVEMDLKQFT